MCSPFRTAPVLCPKLGRIFQKSFPPLPKWPSPGVVVGERRKAHPSTPQCVPTWDRFSAGHVPAPGTVLFLSRTLTEKAARQHSALSKTVSVWQTVRYLRRPCVTAWDAPPRAWGEEKFLWGGCTSRLWRAELECLHRLRVLLHTFEEKGGIGLCTRYISYPSLKAWI